LAVDLVRRQDEVVGSPTAPLGNPNEPQLPPVTLFGLDDIPERGRLREDRDPVEAIKAVADRRLPDTDGLSIRRVLDETFFVSNPHRHSNIVRPPVHPPPDLRSGARFRYLVRPLRLHLQATALQNGKPLSSNLSALPFPRLCSFSPLVPK